MSANWAIMSEQDKRRYCIELAISCGGQAVVTSHQPLVDAAKDIYNYIEGEMPGLSGSGGGQSGLPNAVLTIPVGGETCTG
jgi:hypothetical protein